MKKLTTICEVVIVHESDRIISIHKNDNGDLVGINYMQGAGDSHLFFISGYAKPDPTLLAFYNAVSEYVKGDTLFEKIDNALWLNCNLENEGMLRDLNHIDGLLS
jgi:hypothetical protein